MDLPAGEKLLVVVGLVGLYLWYRVAMFRLRWRRSRAMIAAAKNAEPAPETYIQ